MIQCWFLSMILTGKYISKLLNKEVTEKTDMSIANMPVFFICKRSIHISKIQPIG